MVVTRRFALKEIIIDNGSSADILFKMTFDMMTLYKVMVPGRTLLRGLSGEEVCSIGTIKLLVTFEIEDSWVDASQD